MEAETPGIITKHVTSSSKLVLETLPSAFFNSLPFDRSPSHFGVLFTPGDFRDLTGHIGGEASWSRSRHLSKGVELVDEGGDQVYALASGTAYDLPSCYLLA